MKKKYGRLLSLLFIKSVKVCETIRRWTASDVFRKSETTKANVPFYFSDGCMSCLFNSLLVR